MTERKLATVRRIDEVKAIPTADAIVAYRVGGWWVVDSINKYGVGDLVVYAEPDSWIPHYLAPFLSKGNDPREFEGVKGERLRTVKLRGQLSQGLLLPLSTVTERTKETREQPMGHTIQDGDDVTNVLGINKWEAPVNAQLAGVTRGNFPALIPKTDAERIQNLGEQLVQWVSDDVEFEVTIKLDGSSMTVARIGEDIHVCSRNLSLKLDQEGNSFVDTAKKLDLVTKLQRFPREIAIQGELIGPGIQKNQERLSSHMFYVFEIYDIRAGRYLSPVDRYQVCTNLGLNHVPVLHQSVTLSALGIGTVDQALEYAEGPSLTPSVKREGVVFKNYNGSIKWKSISNTWLLKND